MATCLLHLLPDVQDQMISVFKNLNLDPNFPVAEFLMSIGFLIVLIVEQIVLSSQENSNYEKISILSHQHSHAEPYYQNYGSLNTEQTTYDVVINEDNHSTLPPNVHSHEDHEVHAHEVSFHQDPSSHSILRSLLLIFALSLHSVFEGLAIGLQSSIQNVIRIFCAVLIHKCIIAFTLGLNLSCSKLERNSAIKGIVFFALTSPVGIIIGIVVVDFVTGMPMLVTSGILQGLATGTFLYVTFFEVLPHELNSNEDRMLKMGCLVLGFSAVSVLLILFPD